MAASQIRAVIGAGLQQLLIIDLFIRVTGEILLLWVCRQMLMLYVLQTADAADLRSSFHHADLQSIDQSVLQCSGGFL